MTSTNNRPRHLHVVCAPDASDEQPGPVDPSQTADTSRRADPSSCSGSPSTDGCAVCERFVLEDVVGHCEDVGVSVMVEAGPSSFYVAVGPTSRGTWLGVADDVTRVTSDLHFPGGQDLVFEVDEADVTAVFAELLARAMTALDAEDAVTESERCEHRQECEDACRRLAAMTCRR